MPEQEQIICVDNKTPVQISLIGTNTIGVKLPCGTYWERRPRESHIRTCTGAIHLGNNHFASSSALKTVLANLSSVTAPLGSHLSGVIQKGLAYEEAAGGK